MRLRNWLGYGTALLLASACGDDGNGAGPDAAGQDPDAETSDPDGDVPDPDAGPGAAGFDTDESGMVFFERIVVAEGANEGEEGLLGRWTVNFVEPLAAAEAPVPGGCLDAWYETSEYWPAQWPDDATSLDVGDVTIQAFGYQPYTATPRSFRDGDVPPRDFLARQNDLAIAEEFGGEGSDVNPADIFGEGDLLFDVGVSGSDSYPQTVWQDAVYMPSLPTLTPSPYEQLDLDNHVDENGDLVLTYEAGENSNLPEGELPLSFVGFAKPGDGNLYPTKVCLAAGDTITVDADTVAELKSEGVVGAVRGQLVHRIQYMEEENPDAGRFDLVGLNCFMNTITFAAE